MIYSVSWYIYIGIHTNRCEPIACGCAIGETSWVDAGVLQHTTSNPSIPASSVCLFVVRGGPQTLVNTGSIPGENRPNIAQYNI